MRVRTLKIRNFRAFGGERQFSLSERFTIVAGVNGRGKTAILDGLALLVSRLLRSLALGSGNQRTIAVTDVFSGSDQTLLTMQVNCGGVPVEFRVEFARDSERVLATRLSSAVKRAIINNYGDPNRTDDQAPVAIYYTTDRAGLRLPRSLPSTLPFGQQLAHNGALSNRMVDYRDLMARYRVWTASADSRERRAFDKALTTFLDGFSDVVIEERPLRMTVRKGDRRLSLTQLSDGERAFIAIVGDMVRRLSLANPDLADPLEGHGLVLIDELELHLHPTWQRGIVEKLRTTFPNIQFIGTTHSPFVIQSLRPGELINLDPEEFTEYADRSIEDIAENVMGVEVPQKSERYRQMMRAAEEYFRLLRTPGAPTADIGAAENTLNELAAPFSDDPAFQALLKLERDAHVHGGGDATG